MTHDEIVADYISRHREWARKEMAFYADSPDLSGAIRAAALCRLRGRRHPHQRRIPPAVLAEAEQRLQSAAGALRHAPDFGKLFDAVEDSIGSIRGIGELTVYDVTHRIGVFLGKAPALVYLHAGTRTGACALGLRGKTVSPTKLPSAFARLSAAEIEDCLCIYKNELHGRPSRGGSAGCSFGKAPRGCLPASIIDQGGSRDGDWLAGSRSSDTDGMR